MNDDKIFAKMETGIELFKKHVGMALILKDKNGPESVLRNGTISFVDSGSKKLLVTNAHVFEAFENAQESHPEALLAVTTETGTKPIDISSATIVDRIKSGVDLAILDFEYPKLFENAGKSFCSHAEWPPPRAREGDHVFLVGFPELHRKKSNRGLECRLTGICEVVTACSDRQLLIVDEDLSRRVLKSNPHLKDFGSLSGMSGCAAFSQKEGEAEWALCGFMYEASEASANATICINHVDFIRDDGGIDRGLMPWL